MKSRKVLIEGDGQFNTTRFYINGMDITHMVEECEIEMVRDSLMPRITFVLAAEVEVKNRIKSRPELEGLFAFLQNESNKATEEIELTAWREDGSLGPMMILKLKDENKGSGAFFVISDLQFQTSKSNVVEHAIRSLWTSRDKWIKEHKNKEKE